MEAVRQDGLILHGLPVSISRQFLRGLTTNPKGSGALARAEQAGNIAGYPALKQCCPLASKNIDLGLI